MRDRSAPIKTVEATHSGKYAAQADYDTAGINLNKRLSISVGARMMVTENLWVAGGVVNGSLGTVRYAIWANNADPNKHLLLVVLFELDGYTGPTFHQTFDLLGLYNLPPNVATRWWNYNNRSDSKRSRTQFP
ncbi:hypothetical protein Slin15195_G129140 [Septoria linicola]|uniref:Uncharacterized protein n=1 Tax=Septoria linicola TaxID=215465 RepID=A0A9Q9EQY1_9PEZI|nr:hypothetical protein Slin14017_G121670 [Septoria linicola]USW59595.1 hypothetical protein Slin15195_G129140 [Septoria linicola]